MGEKAESTCPGPSRYPIQYNPTDYSSAVWIISNRSGKGVCAQKVQEEELLLSFLLSLPMC